MLVQHGSVRQDVARFSFASMRSERRKFPIQIGAFRLRTSTLNFGTRQRASRHGRHGTFAALKETTPKMRKIIVTGFPALENAIDAVNKNADAYALKPPKMKKVLSMLKTQLEKQKAEKIQ